MAARAKLDGRERPETRSRILDAAIRVFSDKGYYQTAVDDIVKASDTSKGSFYHFFPSKQGIFLALVDLLNDQFVAKVERAMAGETSAVRKVDAALLTALKEFASHRRIARILLVEAAGLGHALNEKLFALHASFARLIQKQLDDAIAEQSIQPVDTELVSYAWLGAINEVVLRWLYTGLPDPLDAAAPELRRLLLSSIGAPIDSEMKVS